MPVATTTPPATIGTTHNYRVWPIALGAIAVTAVIAVALFVFWPWQQDRNHGHTDAPTASTPPTSFDSMKDFVTAYYAALPDHAADAWTRLDPHCQEQTGQAAFLSFWATIQSVTVVSISPRDATSVTARLTYVRKNGKVDAEDRWLRMSSANGLLQLNESERISPVAAPTNTTPTSTGPAATQVINAAAVVNGQPANGYTEGQSPSNGNDVFGCDTSPAAVDDGIYRCAPSAADADVCWPSTSPTLLCVDNPFDQIVYRVTYTDPLPFTQKPTEPSPFALLLDDGTRCRLRNGGAWGGRDDGLSGAYYCLSDKRVVLEGETTPAPDRSQSLWTVKLGEIGGGNEHFPPPETHTVIKAWFASN